MSDDNENLKNIIINTLISDDLEEAIRNITMELGKLFNADRVHFRFYDKDINTFSEVVEEYRKNKERPSSKRKMLYPIEFDRFLKDKLPSGLICLKSKIVLSRLLVTKKYSKK